MWAQRFSNTHTHTQRIKARLPCWDWLPEIPSSLLNGWWHSDVSGAPWRHDEWPRLVGEVVVGGGVGCRQGGKGGQISDAGLGGAGRREVSWGREERYREEQGARGKKGRKAKEAHRRDKSLRPSATPSLQCWFQFDASVQRRNGIWQSLSDSSCCWFSPYKIPSQFTHWEVLS